MRWFRLREPILDSLTPPSLHQVNGTPVLCRQYLYLILILTLHQHAVFLVCVHQVTEFIVNDSGLCPHPLNQFDLRSMILYMLELFVLKVYHKIVFDIRQFSGCSVKICFFIHESLYDFDSKQICSHFSLIVLYLECS